MAHIAMQLLTGRFHTSIVALHDVEMALAYCDRIIGIQDGQIALDEPASNLVASDIASIY
jgi:phosphonate transport system ATP-binding protein